MPRKKRHIRTANENSKKPKKSKAEPEPAPKQRCGRDAVLYERQLVITKIKAVAEKAHRQAKPAKDLMAILGSMKTEPKKQRSKLLRKVRRPPEHSSPRNHLAFTRGPCTVRSVPSTR